MKTMSSVVVNDVLEELNEENKRLLNELLFANKCLKVLIEFKTFIDLVSEKLKENLDENQCNRYQKISIKAEDVLKRRHCVNNMEIICDFNHEYNESIESNDNSNDSDFEVSNKKRNKSLINRKPMKRKTIRKSVNYGFNDKPVIDSNIRVKENNNKMKRKAKKMSFKCESNECLKGFKTHKRVNDLKKNVFTCDQPNCHYRTQTLSRLERHMSSDLTNRSHICSFDGCGKRFKDEYILRTHVKAIHERICPFTCDWPGCDFATAYKRHLTDHKLRHSEVRDFVCDYPQCGKGFKTRDNMIAHKRIHCSDSKRYSCSWPGCQYKTYQTGNLTAHMSKHSTDRPFVCGINGCDKRFKISAMVKNHRKTHLPRIELSRDFKCEVEGCGKAFRMAKELRRHSHTHGPARLSCEWPGCPYMTTTQRNLKKHRLCHTNERNYICEWPECGKRFKASSCLTDHLRIHTNERRYKCQFPGCQYSCVFGGNLKKHMRRHDKSSKDYLLL